MINRLLNSAPVLVLLLAFLTACPSPAVDVVPDPTLTETGPAALPPLPEVPEALIKASGIEEFEVDGLKVILKPTKGKSVVAAQMFVRGGVANLTAENAGVEALSLHLATTGGTATTDRGAFAQKIQAMGSSIGSSTSRDYSSVSLMCVKPYFDDTWSLFTQVLTEPVFDDKQFKLEKARAVDSLASLKEDPDRYVAWIANELHYQGHPYALRPEGHLEAVKSLTRQQLATYHKGLLTRERLLLVVVGDMDRATLEGKIKKDLAALPKGDVSSVELAAPGEGISDVTFEPRPDLPTNYMLGYFSVPSPTHPDYFPTLVAVNYLSDRLFEEVRTKRNLTYAVAAGMGTSRANYGYLYATAVDPKTTVEVIYQEVDNLAATPLTDKAFRDLVNVFLTEYYLKLETNGAQASLLGRTELYGGGWEQTLTILDNVRAVTPDQVQKATDQYIRRVHWGYVGNPEKADKAQLTGR